MCLCVWLPITCPGCWVISDCTQTHDTLQPLSIHSSPADWHLSAHHPCWLLSVQTGRKSNGLVGIVGVVLCCRTPPNDMSSQHVPMCRKNVGNVGPKFCQILSSGPCQTMWHVMTGWHQPTCWLILFDIKKKQQSFAETRAIMVWFGTRKSQKLYRMC